MPAIKKMHDAPEFSGWVKTGNGIVTKKEFLKTVLGEA